MQTPHPSRSVNGIGHGLSKFHVIAANAACALQVSIPLWALVHLPVVVTITTAVSSRPRAGCTAYSTSCLRMPWASSSSGPSLQVCLLHFSTLQCSCLQLSCPAEKNSLGCRPRPELQLLCLGSER